MTRCAALVRYGRVFHRRHRRCGTGRQRSLAVGHGEPAAAATGGGHGDTGAPRVAPPSGGARAPLLSTSCRSERVGSGRPQINQVHARSVIAAPLNREADRNGPRHRTPRRRGRAPDPWRHPDRQPLGEFCEREHHVARRLTEFDAYPTREARDQLAGELGFEPRLTESESAVLPLNYSPIRASGQRLGPKP
jgi:hypothetical protein